MACYQLRLKNEAEFLKLMKNRDSSIVLKMVKCVLSAVKRKKDSIVIFEMTFDNGQEMEFSVEKKEYKSMLQHCLDDMIKIEEYELCAEIVKLSNKPTRTRKKKEEIN